MAFKSSNFRRISCRAAHSLLVISALYTGHSISGTEAMLKTTTYRSVGANYEDELAKIARKLVEIFETHMPYSIKAQKLHVELHEGDAVIKLNNPVIVNFLYKATSQFPSLNIYSSNNPRFINNAVSWVRFEFRETHTEVCYQNANREIIKSFRHDYGLVYLLYPEVAEAIESVAPEGSVHSDWISEFIELANSPEVFRAANHIQNHDLLDKRFRYEAFDVNLYSPMPKVRRISLIYSNARSAYIILVFEGPFDSITFHLHMNDGTFRYDIEEYLEPPLELLSSLEKKYGVAECLTYLRRSLLSVVENEIKKFLDAYRRVKVALAYMNL